MREPVDRKPLGGPRAPLLLMPMRLEYRVVSKKNPPKVLVRPEKTHELGELRRKLGRLDAAQGKEIRALQDEITKLSRELARQPRKLDEARLQARKELWLRWYPDDGFAEAGIAPPSSPEAEALAAFLAHPGADDWPKLREGEGTALWAELVAVAGPARAVHLMRSRGDAPDPHWQDRIGRIAGLPARVGVFALTGEKLHLLGEGVDIPANGTSGSGPVSYSPAVLDEGAWMRDFDTALESGMGLKLQDDKAVDLALGADWLVCAGVSGAGADDLKRLVADGIAGGGFGILAQDTPTNNTPTAQAGGEAAESVAADLARRAAMELGDLREAGIAADRLAHALGLDVAQVRQASGADETGHLDGAAMIRVIGPALMDGALAATDALDGVEDADFIELLAQHVQARGLLPAMRFGDAAYGILPVTDDTGAQPADDALSKPAQHYAGFVRSYAGRLRRILAAESDAHTLRIEPDDPDAPEKLTDILQSTRVSRRLDVSDEGSDEVRALACPYVDGVKEPHKPLRYLLELHRRKLSQLPVADHEDSEWPLLYRLAHLTLSRNRELEVVKGFAGVTGRGWLRDIQGNWRNDLPGAQRQAVNQSRNFSARRFSQLTAQELNRIPQARLPLLQGVNARFDAGLLRLRAIAAQPDGVERLETLMMEVIDLFQHRLDAWITGLAGIRLDYLRDKEGATGLALGWYGFLGQLREGGPAGAGDGYIQAPGQGQAVSAAILRSAYLRNRGEGAFQIDLSSGRTQRALKIMDHMSHGIALPETLGLRGERWLRNAGKSAAIHALREAFPLENPDVDGKGTRGGTGTRCFDGLKLIEAAASGLNAEARALRKVLADDLDALSDVVVAEAVHHRAGGSAGTAAAWLRVLSGGPVPGRPEFLRTERSGHASDYRVTLVLPQDAPAQTGGALSLAEYGLAAMMERQAEGLGKARVTVRLRLDEDLIHESAVRLEGDLGIDPMQAGQLGEDGVRRRAIGHAITGLHAGMPVDEMHARGLHVDRAALEAAGMVAEVNLGEATAGIAIAAQLWKMAHAAQPLAPGDLSNAAAPDQPLDEAAHVAALRGAAGDLWARAERLLALTSAQLKTLQTVRKRVFRNIAVSYETPGLPWGADRRTDQKLRLQVSKLHAALRDLEALRLEGAGQFPAASRLVAAMSDSEAGMIGVEKALAARIHALRAALTGRATDAGTLPEARADLNAATDALRAACGAGKLAIFPVFAKTPPVTPMLAGDGQSPAAALGPWPRYRARLQRLLERTGGSHLGYLVHPDATADDKDSDSADPRDEAQAPRSYHRGVFVARQADMRAGTLSGMVVDEWVEKRPATEQAAAIALNYDSPQAEAPNCLILCVPDRPDAPRWTPRRAAGHVRMMLDLMKLRALSTQTTPLSDTVLPLANRVAHVGRGPDARPRIPVARFIAGLMPWFELAGRPGRVTDDILSKQAQDWNQTRVIAPGQRRRE